MQYEPNDRTYAMYRRQLFYVRQRLFYILSDLLTDNQRGSRLRAALLRLNGSHVGIGCQVRSGLRISETFSGLTLGDWSFINAECFLDCEGSITIGRRVGLGYQVTLVTGNHHLGPTEARAGRFFARPIVVGDGAWIGARAMVMPGVTIGAGAVVSAGAKVAQDVPPDTLVDGVPAKVVTRLAGARSRGTSSAP
jgi:acetyltransferase-like isoleucine patch superfamily enzyme